MSDLLPPNAAPSEHALDDSTARIGAVPVDVATLWNPASCPAAALPWLAWAFSVDDWDVNWTEAQKRQTVQHSIDIHRHKGTIGAVRAALGALGYISRVQEWFNQLPAGSPYTFRLLLEVDQVGIVQSGYAALLTVLERTKNLRSHLSEIELTVKAQAGPTVAACALVGNEIVVAKYQWPIAVFNETTICM